VGSSHHLLTSVLENGDLRLDCYHVRKEIYEAAAREGGMKFEVNWSVVLTDAPNKFLRVRMGRASLEELENYRVTAHYGMLEVTK